MIILSSFIPVEIQIETDNTTSIRGDPDLWKKDSGSLKANQWFRFLTNIKRGSGSGFASDL